MSEENSAYAWGAHYKLPPHGNMMVYGDEDFVQRGTALFATIEAAIKEYRSDRPIEKMNILDFGCGVGRVALPFFYKYKRPNRCVDISLTAIRYLQEVIPEAKPRLSRKAPPLEFYADGFFDVIYSISVFTHLEPAKADLWLREIHRLLKPGGLALLSTSSHTQLEWHHKDPRRAELWKDVSVERFEREGIIFRGTYHKGMDAMYGCAIHMPWWIKQHWSALFDVKESQVRAGLQDLNILIKR